MGLDPSSAHSLLNNLAHRAYHRAARFTHGQVIEDLISGFNAVIVEGAATEALHPGTAYARYGKKRVRLQQIAWPDEDGRFPWEAGYGYPPHAQPLLSHTHPL